MWFQGRVLEPAYGGLITSLPLPCVAFGKSVPLFIDLWNMDSSTIYVIVL